MSQERSAEWLRGYVYGLEAHNFTGLYAHLKQVRAELAKAEAREHLNKLNGECDCGWKKSAAEFYDGMKYYRGLVVKIGEIIGHESHIAQDGSDMGEVLCAGVPDLVAAMKAREASVPTAADALSLPDLQIKHAELAVELFNAEARLEKAAEVIAEAERWVQRAIDNAEYETEYDGQTLCMCHYCNMNADTGAHTQGCELEQARDALTAIAKWKEAQRG
jgi:hypothetical protein